MAARQYLASWSSIAVTPRRAATLLDQAAELAPQVTGARAPRENQLGSKLYW